jgi:two-component system chemotaxis sensor kinase CheA
MTEFLTETAENLAALDIELVKLEQDPKTPGLLANIFRLVHTIKGTCGFFGLPRLELLAHAGENVLGRFRDGELVVTPAAISVILAAIDGIKAILATLEATGAEPEGDDAALIARLNALSEGSAAASEPVPTESAEELVEVPAEEAAAPVKAARAKRSKRRNTAPKVEEPSEIEEQPEEQPVEIAELAGPADEPAYGSDPVMTAGGGAPVEAVTHESAAALQSIRVNVDLLESLMTTVSELVLSRNQLLQLARRQKDSEFVAPLQRLNHVVSELQENVMKTRMQPIGNAWAKLPRIVRDLAHETNKKIELVMKGADTELDRQVLELIKDPLTHMVRNSADHGIEPPDERRPAGKPETGVITLDAFHQGGQIVIEISDDGRGLNIHKIKAKALKTGLATEAELAGLSEIQIQQFIFRAGFSTAEKITSVSGRGVGMDVVRTNIEKIGGTIEVGTRPGRGTRFTIKIPLTLAIVSALIVEVGGQSYAVPQTSVIELVRTSEAGTNGQRIERINGVPVLRLRERLLPLVVLSELLKLDQPAASALPDERFVVVTQVGSQVFGMIVDQVFDTEEIVVKPMGSINRHLSMFSGNTILGDGSVIMILDPGGVAGALGNANAAAEAAARTEAEHHNAETREKSTLLVFRAGAGAPKAVPLQQIARLEEFERKDIESISDRYVTQYRGKLIPVVSLDPMGGVSEESRQPALVFADEGRVMALLVDTVVDILETEIDVHHSRSVPGVMGSAIIAGHATELIDAGYFCEQAFQGWSEPADWSGTHHDGLGEIDPSAAAMVNPTSGSLEMARAA